MHPETTVCFEKRTNDRSHWIKIEHPEGTERPQDLLDALAAIGFAEDTRFAPPPHITGWPHEIQVFKRGSGLFTDWTAEEKPGFMREARAVLRRFGFTNVPVNTLTLADLL